MAAPAPAPAPTPAPAIEPAIAPAPRISRDTGGRKSYQEKHAHYLQLVQERNRVRKQLEDQQKQRTKDLATREQGFSTHFSGANAKEKIQAKNSFGVPKPLPKVARAKSGERGMQWELHTVELKGEDGEVYAVRPGLDLRPLPEVQALDATLPPEDDAAVMANESGGASNSSAQANSAAEVEAEIEELSMTLRRSLDEILADDEKSLPQFGEFVSKDCGVIRDDDEKGSVTFGQRTAPPSSSQPGWRPRPIAPASSSAPGTLNDAAKKAVGSNDASNAVGTTELPTFNEWDDWESDGDDAEKDSTLPEGCTEVLKASLTGTKEQLQSLRLALDTETELEEPENEKPPPSPGTIAKRIANLDSDWRSALLQLLDEAEAAKNTEKDKAEGESGYSKAEAKQSVDESKR